MNEKSEVYQGAYGWVTFYKVHSFLYKNNLIRMRARNLVEN